MPQWVPSVQQVHDLFSLDLMLADMTAGVRDERSNDGIFLCQDTTFIADDCARDGQTGEKKLFATASLSRLPSPPAGRFSG